MKPLKVLMVASEVAPLAKAGGLADVVGVLPKQLVGLGVDCRVIMPLYKCIKDRYGERLRFMRWSMQKMGWRSMYSGLLTMEMDGVVYYFIDNEFYFNHDAIYLDYSFDIERFCFFQRAVLECLGEPMDFEPDIVHCHDWQAGMIPVLLDAHYFSSGYHRQIKVVFTIHNLKYQGIHGIERIADLCDLGNQYMTDYGVLKDGVPNFMKAGIVYSDAVTTVSPTYAQEIMNDFYGEGLDGVLRNYAYKLSGILNGIDEVEYNPQTDKHLARPYGLTDWEEGKLANKRALREELELECPESWPLLCMISRLVDQKGLDLLLRVLDEMLDYNIQMVVIGVGDRGYEDRLRDFAWRRRDRFRAVISFNNSLAHRLYAGADMMVMPSIFEPCGLTQMIAMRYGTLPIVRETGGLKDTVKPYNRFTGEGNGFSFSNINAHEFLFTVKYAVDTFWANHEAWKRLAAAGMSGDYGWEKAGREYVKVYARVLETNVEQWLPPLQKERTPEAVAALLKSKVTEESKTPTEPPKSKAAAEAAKTAKPKVPVGPTKSKTVVVAKAPAEPPKLQTAEQPKPAAPRPVRRTGANAKKPPTKPGRKGKK